MLRLPLLMNIYGGGFYLVISALQLLKLDPKLSLRMGNCKKEHSVICRAEIQKINSLKETSKFPCLATSNKGRAKRSPKEDNHGKGENDTGELSNIFSKKVN